MQFLRVILPYKGLGKTEDRLWADRKPSSLSFPIPQFAPLLCPRLAAQCHRTGRCPVPVLVLEWKINDKDAVYVFVAFTV